MKSPRPRSYVLSGLLRFWLYFLISGGCVLVALLSLEVQKFNLQKFQSEKEESVRQSLAAKALQTDLVEAIDDTYTISGLQVLDQYVTSPTEVNQHKIVREFQNFAVYSRVYDHIAFLDATGMERIRVNFDGHEAKPVAKAKLQDKSKRYYFHKALQVKADAIFISPMDLNIEYGEIERPIKPTIRFVKPVYNATGQLQGVLVLSYLSNILLEDFRRFMSGSWGNTMMVNSKGYWLASPDRQNEWAFMFGKEDTFAKANPIVWAYINTHNSGVAESPAGLFVFNTALPYEISSSRGAPLTSDRVTERYWKIITHVPVQKLTFSPLFVLQNRVQELVGLFLVVGVLSAALAWVRTNYVTKANALRKSELHFRELIDQASDGIFIANLNGHYTDVNTSGCNMLGYDRDEIVGKTVADFMPSEDVERVWGEQSEKNETDAQVVETAMFCKDGSRLAVEISAKFLSGDRWQGIVRDISDRKRTELELQEYRERLEEMVAQRTAALEATNKELEAFSYSIAHDLRAPLRAITSFSQILHKDASQNLNEQQRRDLQRIIIAGSYMARLIDDILDLARIGQRAFTVDTVDLSQLVRNIVEEFKQLYPRQSIQVDIASGMKCKGDARLINIIVENLLKNAWKFTSKRNNARIEFGSQVSEKGTVYYISDNGAGFDMKYVHKLFTPFGRLHGAGEFEGAGIGLVAVQSAIRRHNGNIWATSKLGEGTTFYFTLHEFKNESQNKPRAKASVS